MSTLLAGFPARAAALLVLVLCPPSFARAANSGPVPRADPTQRPAARLAWELEQPANTGSGLAIPGDVNVVAEGGLDAGSEPGGEVEAPAAGHRGEVVGSPLGERAARNAETVDREGEMDARSNVPLGIDGPSPAQLDLETPSERQMELETPDERQQEVEH